MPLNYKSTAVLCSLLEHSKLKVICEMAVGWPACSSLARGMGVVWAAPWALQGHTATHQSLLSIRDGAEPKEKLPETELWEAAGVYKEFSMQPSRRG